MTVTKTAIVGVEDSSQSTDRPDRIRIAGLRVSRQPCTWQRSSFIDESSELLQWPYHDNSSTHNVL